MTKFLLSIMAVLLFIILGVWQLHRGHVKQGLLNAKPQQISIQGEPLPVIMYLDNQHHQHIFGYDVMMPVLTQDGFVVMVDRGFKAADVTRQDLPEVKLSQGLQEFKGIEYYPRRNIFLQGPSIEVKSHDTIMLEGINYDDIGEFLHKKVLHFVLRMECEENSGFICDWPLVNMLPQRHYAYALQWFCFAAIAVLILAWSYKKK
jgi:surfeit locus 1 family protein